MTELAPPPATPRYVLPECPYVGLTPFGEEDWRFFFGREEDRQILVSNLAAARLTLVYGPTGVGKSSLLRAGVVRDLHTAADAAVDAGQVPESIVVVFASWRERPLAQLAALIDDTVAQAIARLPAPMETLGGWFDDRETVPPLDELLATWNERLDELARRLEIETGIKQPHHVELLIILDQFEEFFLYHGDDTGPEAFADGFARAVNRRDIRANFLLSIREDAYAQLDSFEEAIPGLFNNNIRIEHLARAAAEEAIRGPVRRYRELGGGPSDAPYDVEAALVDEVLAQVKTGAFLLGQRGGGGVESADVDRDLRVETPFLQLVMERLWQEERKAKSPRLRLETLNRLQGAKSIVHEHLTNAVAALEPDEQAYAARVFTRLVTPSGTKIAYSASDLAKLDKVDRDRLVSTLETLTRARILRSVASMTGEKEPHYEIFHDVLAPAVLAWSERWLQAQEHAEDERRLNADLKRQTQERLVAEGQAKRERQAAARLRLLFRAAGGLLVLALGFGILAAFKWHDANVENHRADVSELRRQMSANLSLDPAAVIPPARAAIGDDPQKNGWAVGLLRQALRQSNLIAAFRPGTGSHPPAVQDAALSSDGRRVLTVAGGFLDLWSAKRLRHIGRLARGARIVSAAFSPDGKMIVAGARDGSVFFWPADLPRTLLGHTSGAVVAVAFDSSSRQILTANGKGGKGAVSLWGVGGNGTAVRLRAPGGLTTVQFSPDGTLALAASDSIACVWDTRNGRLQYTVHAAGQRFVSVSNHPKCANPRHSKVFYFSQLPPNLRVATFGFDGRLITGDDTGAAEVWDGRTGRYLFTHTMSSAVTSIASDVPRKQFVTGSADGSVDVWQAATGKLRLALRGHVDQVRSVAVSSDGRLILTASDDQTAAVWDATHGTRAAVLRGDEASIGYAAFSRDESRILTASDDGTARLWRMPQTADFPPTWYGPNLSVARFSSDGTKAAVAGSFRSRGEPALVLDTRTGTRISQVDRDARFATFSPDGRRVLTVGGSHVASWNAKTWKEIARQHINIGVYAISADGRWIVLHTNPRIQLWDTERALPGPSMREADFAPCFNDIDVSNDGRYVAFAHCDGAAGIWNVAARRRIARFRLAPNASPGSFKLSPDGRALVGVVGQSGVTVWATRTGKKRFVLPTRDSPSLVRFSPGGGLIATAGDGNAVRVWNADTGTRIASLRGHEGKINDAAFSRDGRFIVTASDDGTARVWLTRTSALLGVFRQGEAGHAERVAIDSTATHVLMTGSDGRVAVYTCDICTDVVSLRWLALRREAKVVGPDSIGTYGG
jgi:WD40 repeat protein